MTVPLRGISAGGNMGPNLFADPLGRGAGICSLHGEGGYPICPPSTYAPDENIHCPPGQIIGPASAGGVCTPALVSPPIIYPTAQPVSQPSRPAFQFPTTPTAAQTSGPAHIQHAFTPSQLRASVHHGKGMGSFCNSGTSDTAIGAALIGAAVALAYLAMRRGN